jgi:hypothetical protein
MQFRAPLEIAINNVDPSGHSVVGALAAGAYTIVDTVWDIVDVSADVRDCFGDSDSLACAVLPIDALAVVALFAEGPSNNVGRRAAKAADVEDARRVIVELGSGDFSNLRTIALENRGARVIGIEHPDTEWLIKEALKHPGKLPEWDEIARGYQAALEAGAEVHFLDFGQGIPFEADEIISIAPNPFSASGVVRATASGIAPGGRIYVAAVPGEATARWLSQGFYQTFGVRVDPVSGVTRYPSSMLPGGTALIFDFVPR